MAKVCLCLLNLLFGSVFLLHSMKVSANLKACEPCPVGEYISIPCNDVHPNVCKKCPRGHFQSTPNNRTICDWCQSCKRNEIVREKCSATKDTVCRCPTGFVYDPIKPCEPCKDAENCEGNGDNGGNEGGEKGGGLYVRKGVSDEVMIAIIIGATLVVVFIIIIIAVYCFRRRRRRLARPSAHLLTPKSPIKPDVVKDAVVRQNTPPLPPPRTTNDNYYSPIPSLPRVTTPQTRINCSSMPFKLVEELNFLLSSSYTFNYKHLAGELGYSHAFVRQLTQETHPVEALLGAYATEEEPTKERLCRALLTIGRSDVAAKVQSSL
ncbi:tumor necrosis factor receptor superfamily member 16-like isoform X2 [Hydractinia symbiolongicarpus]|uniref:tumor necrosis factor receptor superfamily member 16-like isoform X2 n=1 Tax=Hydractinia symbiolongicarpus TaxID=13093 RepID=UPI0025501F24|nr:tumor necrosis factor receptor superfamily member 16-like isoform X2 [Hydractinia symbiolongicarpus]